MREPVIVAACRTPIGKFQGTLSGIKAPQLGAVALEECLKRAGLSASEIEEVIMGNVLQAGLGQNPARQASIAARIPDSIPAVTINKVCGSGLKAVMLAAQAIKAGDHNVILAGGMENMSQAPFLMKAARNGLRMGHGQIEDSMICDGLWDVYNDFHMGNTAELVAREYSITRAAQDEYALQSQQKALASQVAGRLSAEICPVTVMQKKESVTFSQDEGIRPETSPESLKKLKPAFVADGTVTAGNASTINDGAAALLITSRDYAKAHGLKILAKIRGYSSSGMAPEWVMMAPVPAVEKLLTANKLSVSDIDLFEVNEAFAAAALAITQKLSLSPERVNVHGGAIALGHPIGASGARILTTLVYAMHTLNKTLGVAALCLGGGNAVSMLLERE